MKPVLSHDLSLNHLSYRRRDPRGKILVEMHLSTHAETDVKGHVIDFQHCLVVPIEVKKCGSRTDNGLSRIRTGDLRCVRAMS